MKINKVGILGSGTMGAQIAAVFACCLVLHLMLKMI